MSRAWGRAGLVFVAVVVADQVSKALVVAGIAHGERRNVFLGVDLVHVSNRGIAFGFFGGSGVLLTVFTLGALILLLAYFSTHASRPWLWLPTGLLLGGAIGNLLDRVRDHAVTDFIDVPLWPAFNLADVAITFGVAALVLALEAGREQSRGEADGAGA